MALISCDMRQGRTDEQKRKLAAGLLRVISEATGEPKAQHLLRHSGRAWNQLRRARRAPA